MQLGLLSCLVAVFAGSSACAGATRPTAESIPPAASPIPPAASPIPPAASPLPPHQVLPTVAEALGVVLAGNPRMLGVGEVHATTDAPPGPTVLAQFTDKVFPVLAPTTTDLVIETWRTDGACGAVEEEVVVQVEVETKRPEATRSELELLVDAAVARGVRPHDLVFSCAEYATLQGPEGQVRMDVLLGLLTDKLGEYALRGLDTPGATVVLYGGAVHNDRTPVEGAERYSYGVAAAARGGEAYVELDLYDAALVRGKRSLVDAAWEGLLDLAGPDHVVLYRRGPASFVLILPTTPAP